MLFKCLKMVYIFYLAHTYEERKIYTHRHTCVGYKCVPILQVVNYQTGYYLEVNLYTESPGLLQIYESPAISIIQLYSTIFFIFRTSSLVQVFSAGRYYLLNSCCALFCRHIVKKPRFRSSPFFYCGNKF